MWIKELEAPRAQALSAGQERWQEMELLRWTVARSQRAMQAMMRNSDLYSMSNENLQKVLRELGTDQACSLERSTWLYDGLLTRGFKAESKAARKGTVPIILVTERLCWSERKQGTFEKYKQTELSGLRD